MSVKVLTHPGRVRLLSAEVVGDIYNNVFHCFHASQWQRPLCDSKSTPHFTHYRGKIISSIKSVFIPSSISCEYFFLRNALFFISLLVMPLSPLEK